MRGALALTGSARPPEDGAVAELDHLLRGTAIHSVFQPIADLYTRRTAGYEALLRGPAGSPLERPDALFAAARASGRLPGLCWAGRGAALRGASDARLGPPATLFVNVEPDALDPPVPEALEEVLERSADRLRVVLEVTERALTARPAELLRSLEWYRGLGWGVALDDVGADRHSLALMPFLRPDVIKLDLSLVQAHPTVEVAEIVNAVNAEAERTGATVLAEGSRPRSTCPRRSRWARRSARAGSSASRTARRRPCPRRSPGSA